LDNLQEILPKLTLAHVLILAIWMMKIVIKTQVVQSQLDCQIKMIKMMIKMRTEMMMSFRKARKFLRIKFQRMVWRCKS
jgi:hypothetical protein